MGYLSYLLLNTTAYAGLLQMTDLGMEFRSMGVDIFPWTVLLKVGWNTAGSTKMDGCFECSYNKHEKG